jgi:hypothetical protein
VLGVGALRDRLGELLDGAQLRVCQRGALLPGLSEVAAAECACVGYEGQRRERSVGRGSNKAGVSTDTSLLSATTLTTAYDLAAAPGLTAPR